MKKKTAIIISVILGVFLLIAVGGYMAGVLYFQDHFLFGTSFLDRNVSLRSLDAVDQIMDEETRAPTLTFIERGGWRETVRLSDFVDYKATVDEPDGGWVTEDQAWAWFASLFRYTDIEPEVHTDYDASLIPDAVASLPLAKEENITEPEDAYLLSVDGVYVLVPSVEGNRPDLEKLENLVRSALRSGEDTIDLEAEDCYIAPAVTTDDRALNLELSLYQAIAYQTIVIDLGSGTATLSPDDILALHDYDDDEGLLLNEDRVREFVTELKEQYDTYEHERLFVNHNGEIITVGTAADTYGYRLNVDETVELLRETIAAKESTTISPVWTNEGAAGSIPGSDIGDTYIEVSIDEQHLWAYYGGMLALDTDIVTGNLNGHSTPRGVFRILYKSRNTTLVGADYESFVNYWMPITSDGVGLHDATWRSSFGGSIYNGNGSHGCVNMPLWAAQEVYELFESGTCVVIW